MAAEEDDIPVELECSICMKLLLDPITVPCGHTFCKGCLERSFTYHSHCPTCRAQLVLGQGVNVLVAGMIADRFPQALAQRRAEVDEEVKEAERAAREAAAAQEAARNAADNARDARQGVEDGEGTAAAPEAAGTARAAAAGTAPVLPLMAGLGPSLRLMPHCRFEVDLASHMEQRLVEYALQGSRRLGVLEPAAAGGGPRLGICLEVQEVDRPPRQVPRAKLMGRFRFWVTEPTTAHADGFELGRCEAFYDDVLPSQVAAEAEEAEAAAAPSRERANEVARSALELLHRHLREVGNNGRHFFEARFGEVPQLRGGGAAGVAPSELEKVSFWLLGALSGDESSWRRWLLSRDSYERLQHCHEKLSSAGAVRVLALPGARSFMHPGSSALQSFLLLLAIVALLLAKSFGLLEFNGGAKHRHQHHW